MYVPLPSLPHTISSAGSPCAARPPAGWQPQSRLRCQGPAGSLPYSGRPRWGIAQQSLAQSKTSSHHTCAVDRTSELDDTSSLPRLYCSHAPPGIVTMRLMRPPRKAPFSGSVATAVLMHPSSNHLPASAWGRSWAPPPSGCGCGNLIRFFREGEWRDSDRRDKPHTRGTILASRRGRRYSRRLR